MRLEFYPLEPSQAKEILTWRYPAPYDYYNFEADALDEDLVYLLAPNHNFWAIVGADRRLEGFCSFGADGQVAGGTYLLPAIDIGMGIRPSLTGRGYGKTYAKAVSTYAIERYGAQRLRVTIADFNQRAQRVWQSIGFEPVQRFVKLDSDDRFVIMTCDTVQEPFSLS